jgi:hypothetical protein
MPGGLTPSQKFLWDNTKDKEDFTNWYNGTSNNDAAFLLSYEEDLIRQYRQLLSDEQNQARGQNITRDAEDFYGKYVSQLSTPEQARAKAEVKRKADEMAANLQRQASLNAQLAAAKEKYAALSASSANPPSGFWGKYK